MRKARKKLSPSDVEGASKLRRGKRPRPRKERKAIPDPSKIRRAAGYRMLMLELR